TMDPHYAERTEGDLTIRLPKQDRELIEPGLLESARRSRDELDRHYGMKAGALRLEFYADPQAFSIRTVGVPSLGALAVCFGPVITFVGPFTRSEEHTSELQSRENLVCRLLLEKKKTLLLKV